MGAVVYLLRDSLWALLSTRLSFARGHTKTLRRRGNVLSPGAALARPLGHCHWSLTGDAKPATRKARGFGARELGEV